MAEWEDIIDLCPKLYKNGMVFECGRGWHEIILDLSLKIEALLQLEEEDKDLEEESLHMYAVQVKEKHGTLRFYMSCETKAITNLIEDTEAASSQTCESCGARGKMRGDFRLETRCDKCFKEEK